MSGINSDSRPFYMFSTELISVPTGFTFLCGLMTLWRGRIRFTVPMLFCLAWFFNFLIGGLSGVFLSDVPSDVTTHGSFFSMAHFHYTIMGGLVFAFFAAIYYWVPKMTGWAFNERLAKIHFWVDVRRVQLDLRAALRGRVPRAAAPDGHLPRNLQFLNDWASVSAFVLGASMLVFLVNLVWSLRSRACRPARTRGSRARSSGSSPRRCRVTNFERIPVFTGDPYGYGTGEPVTVPPGAAPAVRRRRVTAHELEEPPEVTARAARRGAGSCWRARRRSSSSPSSSPTSTSARSTAAALWRSDGVEPPVALGTVFAVLVVACAVAVWLGRAERRAAAGARRGPRARRRRGRRPARPLGDRRVRAERRRIRERLLRLDGVLLPLPGAHARLARDRARDRRIRNPRGDKASVGALSFYVSFLAGIGVLTWIVLYLLGP